ncbi:phosphohistidine phosphatase [Pseudomonas sp. BIGb0408]|uniref:Phosphohistidine phosphatase n=1 Tax=Phytopseudomonas flavescens TaxID=29435 RepID=A0A7Z0BPW3_9GAMM|nr:MULTISPECIES: phosphohistidine phosphatase SixA [Pseudomonas]MCW2292927.1 phosphohistidine phosphatase [Pseudomonas sp. BIGb0408]NYH72503.1 phosphohistidine phosphatase [Pseudomonas flavescens]
MRIWLLRHGQAHPEARTDAQRELTDYGRDEVHQSLELLRGRSLDAIFVSPYVRAQQTAALVRDALASSAELHTVPWLTPESDPRDSLGKLQRLSGQELLLVSHQPFIGALGGLLVHGHRQQPLSMHTASLAMLEGEELIAGLMSLELLAHPDLR